MTKSKALTSHGRVYPLSEQLDDEIYTFNDPETDNKDLTRSSIERLDTMSCVSSFDESSYLKLKPFKRIDPTLSRFLFFFSCFGLILDYSKKKRSQRNVQDQLQENLPQEDESRLSFMYKIVKTLIMLFVCILSIEVVYDLNISQSKLISEQKRAAPLLTLVIIAYSMTTLIIPIMSNGSLMLIGSDLFRFYSRTMDTVCDGQFFGKKTFVDSWLYYLTLVMVAFLDASAQLIVSGIWPLFMDPVMQFLISSDTRTSGSAVGLMLNDHHNQDHFHLNKTSLNKDLNHMMRLEDSHHNHDTHERLLPVVHDRPKLNTQILDSVLVSLSNHYATIIGDINENLERYTSRRLIKQLIILRDSCEQISIMISLPFAMTIAMAFTRQIALIGVYIQSTMKPYENWAILLETITSGLTLFTVFIYCDGLQSESRHTHRLKTEQTVIDDSQGGDQSIYEFLEYLNRLSKSIRITFFNIIAVNKNSLVSLYSHILTLTFVTS